MHRPAATNELGKTGRPAAGIVTAVLIFPDERGPALDDVAGDPTKLRRRLVDVSARFDRENPLVFCQRPYAKLLAMDLSNYSRRRQQQPANISPL